MSVYFSLQILTEEESPTQVNSRGTSNQHRVSLGVVAQVGGEGHIEEVRDKHAMQTSLARDQGQPVHSNRRRVKPTAQHHPEGHRMTRPPSRNRPTAVVEVPGRVEDEMVGNRRRVMVPGRVEDETVGNRHRVTVPRRAEDETVNNRHLVTHLPNLKELQSRS